jgi:hypothetical protein
VSFRIGVSAAVHAYYRHRLCNQDDVCLAFVVAIWQILREGGWRMMCVFVVFAGSWARKVAMCQHLCTILIS